MIFDREIISSRNSSFDSGKIQGLALYAFMAIFVIFLAALVTNLLPLIALALLLAFVWKQSNNIKFHRG